MFLTAAARHLESTAEDGEERVGINLTFAKDRRSSGTLDLLSFYFFTFLLFYLFTLKHCRPRFAIARYAFNTNVAICSKPRRSRVEI